MNNIHLYTNDALLTKVFLNSRIYKEIYRYTNGVYYGVNNINLNFLYMAKQKVYYNELYGIYIHANWNGVYNF